jgi:hypothetical protein
MDLNRKFAQLEERIENNDKRYQQRWESDKEALTAALAAQQKAVDKAEIATAARFESVNEFRGQLGDQARTLLPRAEYEVQHQEDTRQIAENRDALAALRQVVAVGSPDIRNLQLGSARQIGSREQSNLTWARFFGMVTVFVLVVGVLVSVYVALHG